MKKKLGMLLVAATLAASGASAATLDFVGEANNNGERGVASGTILGPTAYLDVAVKLTSNYIPYLDADTAGLGVCKSVTSSAQCVDAGDDNVTLGEWVELEFAVTMETLGSLVFRKGNHALLTTANRSLMIGVNGGAMTQYSFAQAITAVFHGVNTIRFAYDDAAGANDGAAQFYLSSAVATPVPLPAGVILLGSAFGAFGLARRRKTGAKKAA